METVIFIGIVAFIVIGIVQYNAKNAPIKAIENNENKAGENREKLIKYLKEVMKINAQTIKENKPFTKDEIKNTKTALKEQAELLDTGIAQFEEKYIQLKERYKFDLRGQMEASVDYCDWFYHYADFYNPIRREAWYEDGWEERKEALIKIKEIEKRWKTKTK